jgi:hypothetical protein
MARASYLPDSVSLANYNFKLQPVAETNRDNAFGYWQIKLRSCSVATRTGFK